MLATPLSESGIQPRTGARVLPALADPLNVRLLGMLLSGPQRDRDLQRESEETSKRLLRDRLDELEALLAGQRYLVGGQLTEADVRLFTTLVRFDPVYVGHFKCNLRRLTDYPRLWRYARRIYALPGVARTVDLREIKSHYYRSMPELNPSGIVPRGPALDFSL